jgi:hypothetical protein
MKPALLAVSLAACSCGRPSVVSFAATASSLTEGDSITFVAVVDPPGSSGVLVGEGDAGVYGIFSEPDNGSAASLALTWAQLQQTHDISFIDAEDRVFIARFYDAHGAVTEARTTLHLDCQGHASCHGRCVDVSAGRMTTIATTFQSLISVTDCGACDIDCGVGGGCLQGACSTLTGCFDNKTSGFPNCSEVCRSQGRTCSETCLGEVSVFYTTDQAACEAYDLIGPNPFACDQDITAIANDWTRCCCR